MRMSADDSLMFQKLGRHTSEEDKVGTAGYVFIHGTDGDGGKEGRGHRQRYECTITHR